MIDLLFKMIVGHAIADFWAQTDALAAMKNRHNDPSKFSPKGQKPQLIWPYALTAHALIHGAMVWYITGSFGLFLAETLAHWVIDFGKCDNKFGIHVDQALHLLCKVIWCVVYFYYL